MQLPVSEANEGAVCERLAAGCRAALAAYPTTINQDLTLLRQAAAAAAGEGGSGGGPQVPTPAPVPGSRAAAAARVRLGEKEALDAALQLVEARAAALPGLEYYAERRLKGLGLLDEAGGHPTWDGFFKDGIA